MGTKQTGKKQVKETAEVKVGVLGDGREPQIAKEPKQTFQERTGDATPPWAAANTQGVDDTRPEPQIETVKTKKGKK